MPGTSTTDVRPTPSGAVAQHPSHASRSYERHRPEETERKLADQEPDAPQGKFVEGAPLLVALAEASARGVIATGTRRDCRVLRVRGACADVDAFVMGRLCAQVERCNLQAATRIAANDRDVSSCGSSGPGGMAPRLFGTRPQS